MKRSKKFSDLRKEIKQKCPNFKTMEEIKALAKQNYDKGNCAIAMYVLFGDTTSLSEICRLLDTNFHTIKSRLHVATKKEVLRTAIEYGIFDVSMMFPGIDEELQAILGKKLLTSVLDEQ
jgi:hypothetical protein